MPDAFKKIGDVIKKEDEFEKIRYFVNTAEVIEAFKSLYVNMASEIKTVTFKEETLTLQLENSILKSELKFNQADIIDNINKKLKKSVVKKIRIY